MNFFRAIRSSYCHWFILKISMNFDMKQIMNDLSLVEKILRKKSIENTWRLIKTSHQYLPKNMNMNLTFRKMFGTQMLHLEENDISSNAIKLSQKKRMIYWFAKCSKCMKGKWSHSYTSSWKTMSFESISVSCWSVCVFELFIPFKSTLAEALFGEFMYFL